jgi:hypothetical protein
LFLNFTANHSALFPYFANHGRNSHLPLGLYIRTLSLSYKRYFFIIIYGLVSCSFALQDTIPPLNPRVRTLTAQTAQTRNKVRDIWAAGAATELSLCVAMNEMR